MGYGTRSREGAGADVSEDAVSDSGSDSSGLSAQGENLLHEMAAYVQKRDPTAEELPPTSAFCYRAAASRLSFDAQARSRDFVGSGAQGVPGGCVWGSVQYAWCRWLLDVISGVVINHTE